jgi:hypothetical protein
METQIKLSRRSNRHRPKQRLSMPPAETTFDPTKPLRNPKWEHFGREAACLAEPLEAMSSRLRFFSRHVVRAGVQRFVNDKA